MAEIEVSKAAWDKARDLASRPSGVTARELHQVIINRFGNPLSMRTCRMLISKLVDEGARLAHEPSGRAKPTHRAFLEDASG